MVINLSSRCRLTSPVGRSAWYIQLYRHRAGICPVETGRPGSSGWESRSASDRAKGGRALSAVGTGRLPETDWSCTSRIGAVLGLLVSVSISITVVLDFSEKYFWF